MVAAKAAGYRADEGAHQKRDRGDDGEVGSRFPRLLGKRSCDCDCVGGCAFGGNHGRTRAERAEREQRRHDDSGQRPGEQAVRGVAAVGQLRHRGRNDYSFCSLGPSIGILAPPPTEGLHDNG